MVHWRERLWLATFYPLEVLKRARDCEDDARQ